MAVVLLRGEDVPQVHVIVASAGIYFHVPELASELLGGKPVSRVLHAITYACKKSAAPRTPGDMELQAHRPRLGFRAAHRC